MIIFCVCMEEGDAKDDESFYFNHQPNKNGPGSTGFRRLLFLSWDILLQVAGTQNKKITNKCLSASVSWEKMSFCLSSDAVRIPSQNRNYDRIVIRLPWSVYESSYVIRNTI